MLLFDEAKRQCDSVTCGQARNGWEDRVGNVAVPTECNPKKFTK
eukprot:gene11730-biopygen2047